MTSTPITSYLVVIPARFASTRFPGKALADLKGKTVLRRCFERVLLAVPNRQVVVATDDDRIAKECSDHGMPYVMTSSKCLTGTDRVAEVAEQLSADWYINVQGDEPFLDPDGLRNIIEVTQSVSDACGVINAFATIDTESDFRSPTVPKVVVDEKGDLLYISRGSIPTSKDLSFLGAHRQVGLYAFRASALRRFAERGRKTPLEHIEDIEILRFLEMGIAVRMIEVDSVGIAIDTPEDLERARVFLSND